MTDEEKIIYVFALLCDFFPSYNKIINKQFKQLSTKQLSSFFTLLTLDEENNQLIHDVCKLIERLETESPKKKFYYCISKIGVLIGKLNNEDPSEKFAPVILHFEKLLSLFLNSELTEVNSDLREVIQTTYANATRIQAGYDLKLTYNKFLDLKNYFKKLCPQECSKTEEELNNLILQKKNPQSCSMAARFI